jgi:hypothetical protein
MFTPRSWTTLPLPSIRVLPLTLMLRVLTVPLLEDEPLLLPLELPLLLPLELPLLLPLELPLLLPLEVPLLLPLEVPLLLPLELLSVPPLLLVVVALVPALPLLPPPHP